jgi:uncharacterized protein (TIGR03435 family)
MRNAVTATALALCVLSPTVIAVAQNQPLNFEVASIKQSPPERQGSMNFYHGSDMQFPTPPPISPFAFPGLGRCTIRSLSLRSIISAAYPAPDVSLSVDERVMGGPGWVSTVPYDIDAKAQDVATVTRAQLMAMLRQLLADRFKLQLHTFQKEVKGYSLMVGKDGVKLKPGEGQEGLRVVDGKKMITTNTSLNVLARELSVRLRAPVIDRTGLPGGYAFTLSLPSDNDPPSPSLFTVLREELDLRLESANVPVDIIVIDHAEKPGEN